MENRLRLDPRGALDVAGPTDGSWGQTDALIDPILSASLSDHDPGLYIRGELGINELDHSLARRGIELTAGDLYTVIQSMSALDPARCGDSSSRHQIDYNEGGNNE